MGGRNDIIDGSNEIFDHSTTSGNRSEDHDNSSDLFAVEKVLKATEFLLNFTSSSASSVPTSSLLPHDGNFSISENIKLLSPFNSTSIIGGNFTDQNHSSYTPFIPDYIRSTSIIVCVIILIFGLIGNTMVPIVILKTKDMRNSTNIFLINLSVADLLVLLVCTPTVLVEMNTRPETWVLGEPMCKMVPFIELMVAHASILTILAISFERYYAICEPLKAGYVCTKTRALIICLICWVLAIICTSPMYFIATYRFQEYFDGSIVPVCSTGVDELLPFLYFMGSISVFFFLPLFILIVLYSVIAKHLMINPSLISTTQGNRSNFLKYRKQVILMLAAVVISFFICLMPFRAFTLWIIFVPPETLESLLSTEKGIEIYYSLIYFCRCMWYLNSAINPILYNLMSSKFREGFLKLLKCRPLIRTTSWSEGTRKGTFHTASTNLSSSNHGNNAVNSTSENRMRFGVTRNDLNNAKTVERAPLNVIKYVKIVLDEKLADTLDVSEDMSDSELDVGNLARLRRQQQRKDEEESEEAAEEIAYKGHPSSVNSSNRFLIKSKSANNNNLTLQQKQNYCNASEETVKIPINTCNNDKCLPDDTDKLRDVVGEEIDQQTTHSTTNHGKKDFCINIYNLLSAKESLV